MGEKGKWLVIKSIFREDHIVVRTTRTEFGWVDEFDENDKGELRGYTESAAQARANELNSLDDKS